jgi:ELWxxDGT repeat protein
MKLQIFINFSSLIKSNTTLILNCHFIYFGILNSLLMKKTSAIFLFAIVYFQSHIVFSQIPTLVKDIYTGTTSSNGGLYGILYNGNYIFTAENAANGRELWITDASTAGTTLIKDIYPGATGSDPSDLTLADGVIYFTADNGTNGRELWKTDGTTGGTQMVKDISPGSASGFFQNCCGSFGFNLAWEHNGEIFFIANNQSVSGIDDVELWKSDGTSAGTVRVADINPGNAGSLPGFFTPFNNTLFFLADNGTNGRELWKTDGTAGGTQLVKDIKPGSAGGFEQNCCGLFGLYNVWEHNGSFFFIACSYSDASNDDVELWKSDGTAAGTVRVADINPGNAGSLPGFFTPFNNTLCFLADNGTNGRELWKTDGTTAGTQLVKDIKPGSGGGFEQNCCGLFGLYNVWEHNGSFFFIACSYSDASNDDVELWKSDGTTAGTVRVADINAGHAPSYPSYFTPFNNTLFFVADNGTNGEELWKTDGTTGGTQLVKDIKPGSGGGFFQNCCGSFGLYNVWEHNGSFFFVACSLSNASGDDVELWKSDGTNTGTVRVADINPGVYASYPQSFVSFNNQLFFSAETPPLGRELYKTDGTAAGTVLVKDILSGTGDGVPYLTNIIQYGSVFYFQAYQLGTSDNEIWKTDGTTAGTVKVLDIYVGTEGSYPGYYTLLPNDNFIFLATDISHGTELWTMYLPGITAVDEHTTENFNVYPNPVTNGTITLTMDENMKGAYSFQLLDISGKIVYTRMLQALPAARIPVQLPGVKPGIYFLRLTDSKQFSQTRKISITF